MDALKVSIKSLLKLHFSLLSTASSSMEIEFPVWNLLPAFFLSAFMNVSEAEREKKNAATAKCDIFSDANRGLS